MTNSRILPLCAVFKNLFNKFPSQDQYTKLYEADNNPIKEKAIECLLTNYFDSIYTNRGLIMAIIEKDGVYFERYFYIEKLQKDMRID